MSNAHIAGFYIITPDGCVSDAIEWIIAIGGSLKKEPSAPREPRCRWPVTTLLTISVAPG